MEIVLQPFGVVKMLYVMVSATYQCQDCAQTQKR